MRKSRKKWALTQLFHSQEETSFIASNRPIMIKKSFSTGSWLSFLSSSQETFEDLGPAFWAKSLGKINKKFGVTEDFSLRPHWLLTSEIASLDGIITMRYRWSFCAFISATSQPAYPQIAWIASSTTRPKDKAFYDGGEKQSLPDIYQ